MNNPMDLSEEERKRLQAQLTNVDVGPGGVGASGRMTYNMPVDKNTNLQLIADLEAQKRKGQKASMSTPYVGFNLEKRFKKGGSVKSASVRADGVAKRGKTKGRFV